MYFCLILKFQDNTQLQVPNPGISRRDCTAQTLQGSVHALTTHLRVWHYCPFFKQQDLSLPSGDLPSHHVQITRPRWGCLCFLRGSALTQTLQRMCLIHLCRHISHSLSQAPPHPLGVSGNLYSLGPASRKDFVKLHFLWPY
jgi:hypothetical protein